MRVFIVLFLLSAVFAFDCSTTLVGTTDDGEGILANLTVSVSEGSGKVWVDTMPLTRIETQVSARIAREASCELLGIDCSVLDFYYLIRSEYPMVGGPSAGASMAVCTLASLLNVSLRPDVAMTGTINPDGSVGVVSGLESKSRILEGYNLFLVPEGSGVNDSFIDVIEVGDVVEAFNYYSDSNLTLFNSSMEDVVSNDFIDVMVLMSDSLYASASLLLNGSVAEGLLNQSLILYEQGKYYSSASYSVRSLIESLYLNNQGLDIDLLINETLSSIIDFKVDFLSSVVINHLYDLESFAIVMDRIMDAEDLIRSASLSSDYNETVFLASFAKVRLMTAMQWSLLLDYFNDSIIFDFDPLILRSLALERIEGARNSITYARTIVDSVFLVGSEEYLSSAIDAYNDGDFIYSIFESLRSRAEANLIMEVRGSNVSERINFKRESAVRAVSLSMSKGYLPFLALSFLEYSESFADEPFTELLYLSYSKEFANLGQSINEFIKYSDDFFVDSYSLSKFNDYFLRSLLFIILGFIIGLVSVYAGLGKP